MMRRLLDQIHSLVGNERGQTFVEYALTLAAVSIGLFAVMAAFGVNAADLIDGIWDGL